MFWFSLFYWATGFTTTNFIIYLHLFPGLWSYNRHFLLWSQGSAMTFFWGLIHLSTATVRDVGIFRMVNINMIFRNSDCCRASYYTSFHLPTVILTQLWEGLSGSQGNTSKDLSLSVLSCFLFLELSVNFLTYVLI